MITGRPPPAAPPDELIGVGGVSFISGTSGARPTHPRSADVEATVRLVAAMAVAEDDESEADPAGGGGHSNARRRP